MPPPACSPTHLPPPGSIQCPLLHPKEAPIGCLAPTCVPARHDFPCFSIPCLLCAEPLFECLASSVHWLTLFFSFLSFFFPLESGIQLDFIRIQQEVRKHKSLCPKFSSLLFEPKHFQLCSAACSFCSLTADPLPFFVMPPPPGVLPIPNNSIPGFFPFIPCRVHF